MSESSTEVAVHSSTALPVAQVLTAIVAAAADPNVDVAKMRELLGLQKELMAMQAEQQFTEAFQRLSRELPRVKKNGEVEYKGKVAFKFATYDNLDSVIRPLLEREGFTLSFDTDGTANGQCTITGCLTHVAGHKRKASITLGMDASGGKNPIQAAGSTFSYGRRYTATMLLNIVTEDDDDGQRGGERFITDEEADTVRAKMKEAGRVEGTFLDRMFGGKVRSVEEIENGGAYLAVVNTLNGIIQQNAAKAST